jgi:predicted AAA+ superfamily ATPase
MSSEELKRILIDQKEILEDKLIRTYVQRDVPNVENYLKIPNVLAILGVRRSGKSTLSVNLLKDKNFSYVNFDDEALFGLKSKDLRELEEAIYQVYGNVEYMVFDEIHNVEGWELFVSRLREGGKKTVITGSNSKMLSGELATHLTGRHSDYVLFPFSFKEYLRFKGIQLEGILSTRERAKVKGELENYLDTGGFPESLILGKEQTEVIYNDILFKDVISRIKVKQIGKFKEFANTLVSYYSSEVLLGKLAKVMGIDEKTVSNWAFGMESAYLIYFLPRYGEKLRERLTYNKKVYVVDTGLISRVAVRKKDKGRLMENLVALKLLRDNQLKGVYYVKGKDFEVDFYDEVNNRLIQVTYATGSIEEREIMGLIKAEEEIKARELIIVTYDVEGEETIKDKKIKLMPLYAFLMADKIVSSQ